MAFWRTYYHLVWATTSRQPLITPDRESILYGYMIGKSDAIGCIIHAVGGVSDHVHLVASIPPKLSVADFVKTIKGSSSHHLNHLSTSSLKFGWQDGYGVFTLGSKQLEQAIAYVAHQKAHHQQKTVIPAMEHIAAEG
jgi:putative transposase